MKKAKIKLVDAENDTAEILGVNELLMIGNDQSTAIGVCPFDTYM